MSAVLSPPPDAEVDMELQPKNSTRPLFAGLLVMLVLMCAGTGSESISCGTWRPLWTT